MCGDKEGRGPDPSNEVWCCGNASGRAWGADKRYAAILQAESLHRKRGWTDNTAAARFLYFSFFLIMQVADLPSFLAHRLQYSMLAAA